MIRHCSNTASILHTPHHTSQVSAPTFSCSDCQSSPIHNSPKYLPQIMATIFPRNAHNHRDRSDVTNDWKWDVQIKDSLSPCLDLPWNLSILDEITQWITQSASPVSHSIALKYTRPRNISVTVPGTCTKSFLFLISNCCLYKFN